MILGGWLPDPAEKNALDPVLELGALLGDTPTPSAASATAFLPRDILDQGGDNSCVAQAVSQAIWAGQTRAGARGVRELCSRKFLWWLCRHDLGTEAHNGGCYIRGAFTLTSAHGFVREKHWPHDKPFYLKPPPALLRLGFDQRARPGAPASRIDYQRIVAPKGAERIEAFRKVIARGGVIVAGIEVTHGFKSYRGGEEAFAPSPEDPIAGGHAMVIHAYKPGAFKIRNSWGRDWGESGDGWMSEDWIGQWRDPWTVLAAPAYSDAA